MSDGSYFTPFPVKLDREWGDSTGTFQGAGAALDSPRWFCCSHHDLQTSPYVSFEAINLYLSWRFLITAKMSYLNLYYRERDHFTFWMKQRPLARGKQQIFQHTQHSWVWCFFLNFGSIELKRDSSDKLTPLQTNPFVDKLSTQNIWLFCLQMRHMTPQINAQINQWQTLPSALRDKVIKKKLKLKSKMKIQQLCQEEKKYCKWDFQWAMCNTGDVQSALRQIYYIFIHSLSRLQRYLLVHQYLVMRGYLMLDRPKINTALLEKAATSANLM